MINDIQKLSDNNKIKLDYNKTISWKYLKDTINNLISSFFVSQPKPTLQEVTDSGAVSTNTVTIDKVITIYGVQLPNGTLEDVEPGPNQAVVQNRILLITVEGNTYKIAAELI